MSTVKDLADAVRGFPGVTRKNAIHNIVERFPTAPFTHVFAAEGEDAAAMDIGDKYVLLATDGIMEQLVETNPYFAGYFSVLVNVNDIAAMGGRPIGMVDVMSILDPSVSDAMVEGMREAIGTFGVPIVGGHTHPDCKYNAVDIAIAGIVDKDAILLSSSAQPGDDIVFVMDTVGYYPEDLPMAYVTTVDKDPALVRGQLEAVARVADLHLAHACKDMSNPGHVGTLGMMLESSGLGGIVDVTRIPIPEGVDDIKWALTYQGSAFVFACPAENSERIISMFSEVSCKGAVVGKVDDSKVLRLTDGVDTEVLFDFSKDIITGCGSTRK